MKYKPAYFSNKDFYRFRPFSKISEMRKSMKGLIKCKFINLSIQDLILKNSSHRILRDIYKNASE
jgi:ribosomal protein S3AE